ncbi:DMT family transporter [Inmirania thermothiophila]|uniref:Threonine/homoserine efflux transporter RhtA n=1 Tax=Inmirania thermothiophila TaxID=1750597 RepID=A0A3N1Y6D8_9GAMM|nr:DMT family transporter [Inmirania thermothiophila]ROR34345.1 threonine/homoserine efflux transporter RhtA [Inmirania thermothiophila]
MATGQGRALAGLVTGALAIALAPILVRLSEVGPVATAFHRVALALPLLLLWARGGARPGPGAWLAGALFAADLAVWHLSIGLTTVANATLFANAAPVVVTLLAWGLLGQRPRPLFLAALLCGMAGVALLMGGAGPAGRLAGDLLGLLTAVFYGGYIFAVARARRRDGTAAVMAASAAVSAALLLPLAWASGERVLPQTAAGWAVLLALAWLTHAGGQGLITWALAHLPAAFSAVVLLVQPVAAALIAWPLFGEPLGPVEAAGAALVLAGILLARRASPGAAP